MKFEEAELAYLRKLEAVVRQMFSYTGWDEDCDDDAAICVRAVEQTLDDWDHAKRLLGAVKTSGFVSQDRFENDDGSKS